MTVVVQCGDQVGLVATSDMVRAGKEIETAVLARALQLVFEDRVLVYKNKTVIFE